MSRPPIQSSPPRSYSDQPPALSDNTFPRPLIRTRIHNAAALLLTPTMADIDRMFRSEFAVLADQPQSGLWDLDPVFPFDDGASLDTLIAQGDSALGLFPDRPLGGPSTPDFAAHLHPQPTVRLADLSLGTVPVPPSPPVETPLSTSSSGAQLTDSPTDSFGQTDLSSEDMDSDDFDFAYPSDPEFLPSPMSIDPASLSAPGTGTDPHTVRPSRRGSRTMSKIPVPTPNLTKKSRGRKVPTSNGEPILASSRDKTKKGVRNYTCHVDGCGKCFVRGEHLKRHIRSIHTDEKRG